MQDTFHFHLIVQTSKHCELFNALLVELEKKQILYLNSPSFEKHDTVFQQGFESNSSDLVIILETFYHTHPDAIFTLNYMDLALSTIGVENFAKDKRYSVTKSGWEYFYPSVHMDNGQIEGNKMVLYGHWSFYPDISLENLHQIDYNKQASGCIPFTAIWTHGSLELDFLIRPPYPLDNVEEQFEIYVQDNREEIVSFIKICDIKNRLNHCLPVKKEYARKNKI